MAGQYGNVRVTTQNLTVVKLLVDDNLILVEGSVPGSKNGIVTITDAVKYNVPKDAPFPAGLRSSENSNDAKEELAQVSEQNSNKASDNEGAQGEKRQHLTRPLAYASLFRCHSHYAAHECRDLLPWRAAVLPRRGHPLAAAHGADDARADVGSNGVAFSAAVRGSDSVAFVCALERADERRS